MRVDGLYPNILLRSEPWRLTETEIMHTQICICHWTLERTFSVADVMLCIYAATSTEAWARSGITHPWYQDTINYTLCLSSTITHAVRMASQLWTEASHCCDISSGL